MENREKMGKKFRIFRVLSYFFPISSAGPISGPISGAIFFHFGPEARNPFCTGSAGSQNKGSEKGCQKEF